MAPNEEPATFDPKTQEAEARKAKTSSSAKAAAGATLVSVTLEADTGRVVKIEGVDSGGERHELTEDAKARLIKGEGKPTVRAIVEQAFEAGIDCVLGAEREAEAESEEDADLRRMLLRSLIAHSAAKRLLQREMLSRAIVGTLFEQAEGARAATPESGAAH